MSADPMKELIRTALMIRGYDFTTENLPDNRGLDFYLTDFDVHIEVKQFHTDRIADQMARASNVIAAQGREAISLLAQLLVEAKKT